MSYGSVIAAISTPPGKGGVAIIRISGDGAFDVADKAFRPRGKKPLSECEARRQIYGDVILSGERIDDGLATRFPAPNSYTGEDTVEISCHGGALITQRVLSAVLSAGARAAEAGEFTRRAFINGRLSLTEAEAIGSLLDAKTDGQLRLFSDSARGGLSEAIGGIRDKLTTILSSVFAKIDYPDEELEDLTAEQTLDLLEEVHTSLTTLIDTYPTGRAVNEGIRTVICGRPNVGKSTIYNLICGEDAAIVTDVAGTTRDLLSRTVSMGNVMLNLFDTAGIRANTSDTVERIGIERALAELDRAELIIAVFDGSRKLCDEDMQLLCALSGRTAEKIAVINKCDLDTVLDTAPIEAAGIPILRLSARDDGIGAYTALRELVVQAFLDEKIDISRDAVISTARQNAALIRCRDYVWEARRAYSIGVYADAAASEVERALGALGELDGRAVAEEVVAEIFSKFCVGK